MKKTVACVLVSIILLFCIAVPSVSADDTVFTLKTGKTMSAFVGQTVTVRIDLSKYINKRFFSYDIDTSCLKKISAATFSDNETNYYIMHFRLKKQKASNIKIYCLKNGQQKIAEIKVNPISYKKVPKWIKLNKTIKADYDSIADVKFFKRKINIKDNIDIFGFEYKFDKKYIKNKTNREILDDNGKYYGNQTLYFKKKGSTKAKAYLVIRDMSLNTASLRDVKPKIKKRVYLGTVNFKITAKKSKLAVNNISIKAFRDIEDVGESVFNKTSNKILNTFDENLFSDANLTKFCRYDLKNILYPNKYNEQFEKTGIIKNYHYSSKYSIKTDNKDNIRIFNKTAIQGLRPGKASFTVFEQKGKKKIKLGNVNVDVTDYISLADTFKIFTYYKSGGNNYNYWYSDKTNVFAYCNKSGDTVYLNNITNDIIKSAFKDNYGIKVTYNFIENYNETDKLFSLTEDGYFKLFVDADTLLSKRYKIVANIQFFDKSVYKLIYSFPYSFTSY